MIVVLLVYCSLCQPHLTELVFADSALCVAWRAWAVGANLDMGIRSGMRYECVTEPRRGRPVILDFPPDYKPRRR